MQVLPYRRFSCSATPTLEQDHIDVKFALSFATANVLSVSSKPHGHAGKVQYLREQIASHGLNFVGFQERAEVKKVPRSWSMLSACAGGKGGYHMVLSYGAISSSCTVMCDGNLGFFAKMTLWSFTVILKDFWSKLMPSGSVAGSW